MKKLITILAAVGLAAASLLGASPASADIYGTPPASCGDVKLGDPAGLFYWQSVGTALDNYCYGISWPSFYAESYGAETGYGSIVTLGPTGGYGFESQSWYPPATVTDPVSVAASVAAGEHEYTVTTPQGTQTYKPPTVTELPTLQPVPGLPTVNDVSTGVQSYLNSLPQLPQLPSIPGVSLPALPVFGAP